MASPKRVITNVGLPGNLLRAIGHVAALWAQLEYIVDKNIRAAIDLPGALQINPALIVPFSQRLELLKCLSEQFLIDPENRERAIEIIDDLKLLRAQRNLIVHGSVAHSKQRRKRQVVYWFRRIRWDDPKRIVERRAMTVSDVEAFAAKLSDHVAFVGMIEIYFWAAERASQRKGAS